MSAKIPEKVLDRAVEAYNEQRSPERWDGVPWGEAGTANHRAGIREALLSVGPVQTKREKKLVLALEDLAHHVGWDILNPLTRKEIKDSYSDLAKSYNRAQRLLNPK